MKIFTPDLLHLNSHFHFIYSKNFYPNVIFESFNEHLSHSISLQQQVHIFLPLSFRLYDAIKNSLRLSFSILIVSI